MGAAQTLRPPQAPPAPTQPVRASSLPVDIVQVSAQGLAKGKTVAPPPPPPVVVLARPVVAPAPAQPSAAVSLSSLGASGGPVVAISAQTAYDANLVVIQTYQIDIDTQLKIVA